MKQSIALLSCCAPCSAGIIRKLHSEGADFCVLFMNPNIYPAAEYEKRLAEQKRLCDELGVRLNVGEYGHDEWLAAVRGLENGPERGPRCSECFKFRFRMAAKWARENGCEAVASTFGVSRHKSQAQVDAAAASALPKSLKYINIVIPRLDRGISSEFYRQKYCGCEFSATYRNIKD
ncbi:MAG: epoxyqueuosine reductase QueH [Rickettsiales bacterium]|jgi:predicted adenine nucleotide alpha hydrolase (AANH) superfamily ATPase|nr:epoxyqueuosine reductase QueH [Rickettsiales bacterium]